MITLAAVPVMLYYSVSNVYFIVMKLLTENDPCTCFTTFLSSSDSYGALDDVVKFWHRVSTCDFRIPMSV